MRPAFAALRQRTKDAPRNSTYRKEKAAYEKVRRAEIQYGVKLRKIARAVGEIVGAFPAGDPASLGKIDSLLRGYAALIKPWAEATAAAMLADVNYRELAHWNSMTQEMGLALLGEINKAPTGDILRQLQLEQVTLIQSIPLNAAKRVHELTMEGMISGARFGEIRDDLLRTPHVTESRATLIARTEVGRASTNLAQARATYVGSDGYIWRTSKDEDVRRSHRKLEGTFHKWSEPPICDPPNYRAHAGAIFNCRCYPEIVLPDEFR